jgi:hypothetical protein
MKSIRCEKESEVSYTRIVQINFNVETIRVCHIISMGTKHFAYFMLNLMALSVTQNILCLIIVTQNILCLIIVTQNILCLIIVTENILCLIIVTQNILYLIIV